jgi:hypothetical protein
MSKVFSVIATAILVLLCSPFLMGQDNGIAKRNPTVVVMPSESWCVANGFTLELSGKKLPDYERVFQESELYKAISNDMNGKFNDAGIDMTLLDQALKTKAEDDIAASALTSKSGEQVGTSTYEAIISRFRPDVIIEADWPKSATPDGAKIGFEYLSMTFRIFDGYSNTVITSRTEKTVSQPKGYRDLQSLILMCIEVQMPNIISDIKVKVSDYISNGRPVKVQFRTSGMTLDDEFGEDEEELADIIKDLMRKNSVGGSANPGQNTDNILEFMPRMSMNYIDAESWVKEFTKPRFKELNLKAKYSQRGPGELTVVIERKTQE